MVKYLVLLLLTMVLNTKSVLASDGHNDVGYSYSLIKQGNKKIHVVKIDLNRYRISLASARDSVFGREKPGDVANRYQADIAINSGFFQIGGNEDGRCSGTLIINGKLFGLKTAEHAVFVVREEASSEVSPSSTSQSLSVEVWNPQIKLKIGLAEFKPDRYNKFVDQDAVVLYSSKWGATTLTAYSARKELIISKDMVVSSVENHGNNNILSDGYVLSLPEYYDTSSIKIGDVASFNQDGVDKFAHSVSAVMGIPSLIIDGKINDKLSNSEKHARTSIGVDRDGRVVLVVAECNYAKSLGSMTLKETFEILKRKKADITIDELSIGVVKKILLQELSQTAQSEGLTVKELAEFMLEQGCISAINLDGGGSSSLYINGKYINQSVGDKDEAEGLSTIRPVSDVILFKKI